MTKTMLVAAAGLAATAGVAFAQPAVITFGYTDLAGGYAGTNTAGLFTAVAVAQPGGLRSDGNVTRLQGGPGLEGTANFAPGFVNAPDASDFQLNLSVLKANALATTALGGGTFTMTDRNGDTIGGQIAGTWISFGGATFFNGLLTNVISTNVSGDGTFDGTIGNFGTGGLGVLEGALVQIFLNPATGFFNAGFNNISTGVSGQLVPTPGALALLGLGGLVAGRRRR